MSYHKIYERKERTQILKDSEISMVTGEDGCKQDDTCKEIWIIINTQKSHKLPFT